MIGSQSVAKCLLAASALFMLPPASPAGAASPPLRYVVTDLGSGGENISPRAYRAGKKVTGVYGIEDAGLVLVTGWTNPFIKHPPTRTILWHAGRPRDLGPLDPRALNSRGQIVGYDAHGRIAVWDAGHLRRPALRPSPSTILGYGNCLNDRGWIVGQIRLNGPKIYAFLWDGTRTRRVSPPGALAARAEAVNDRGQALVWVLPRFRSDQVFLWDKGRLTPIRGFPPSFHNPSAACLNNRGQALIDVISLSARHQEAFLWQNGRLRRLRPPAGMGDEGANQINDRGQAVGEAHRPNETRAILWDGGRGVDLNTLLPAGSGWKLLDAGTINGRGQILGSGMYRGKSEAFLLTPASVPIDPSLRADILGVQKELGAEK